MAVSVIATDTLTGGPFGHLVWSASRFGVFTWTDVGPGDGHLRYEVWSVAGDVLTRLSVDDLGLIALYGIRISAAGTSGVVMYNNTSLGGTYGRGIFISSGGASWAESFPGGPFGFADNGGWCAFSNIRYFGPRNDGDCIIATKESGSWVWDFVRPAGWAVNTRNFHWSMPVSATEFISTYWHVAAAEERAAVLAVDTSHGRPFTVTPGAETAIPVGGPSGTFWANALEPLGLRLADRVVYATDEITSAVLTANGSVAVSEVRSVDPVWYGTGGRATAGSGDRWLGPIRGGGGGVADITYSGGAFHYDSGLVATDFVPYDLFRVVPDRFVNLYVGTPTFELVTWPVGPETQQHHIGRIHQR